MERRFQVFWPLTLIAAGVLWILIEIGRVPVANLWALTYLWPLVLIGAGLGLILRSYWAYASALISVLVVGALFLSVLFAGVLGWNHVPSYSIDGRQFISGPVTNGSGHVITQSRDVKDFSSVQIGFPGTVLIQQGTTESMTIEAEDNVVAAISTKVTNGVLMIEGVRDHVININPTRPVKITITAKTLNEVSFDAAGELTVQGLKADAFKVILNGAGNINLNNLKLTSLDAVLSGAGSVHANGVADNLDARIDGLGSFDGANLQSQKATVQLDGLGSADVWAQSSLNATVNGVGSVNYYGSPQVSKSVNGLGTVHSMGSK